MASVAELTLSATESLASAPSLDDGLTRPRAKELGSHGSV